MVTHWGCTYTFIAVSRPETVAETGAFRVPRVRQKFALNQHNHCVQATPQSAARRGWHLACRLSKQLLRQPDRKVSTQRVGNGLARSVCRGFCRQSCRARLPPLCKGRWVGHKVAEPVGLFFWRRTDIVLIHFLQCPDRRVCQKSLHAERASPFPTWCRLFFAPIRNNCCVQRPLSQLC